MKVHYDYLGIAMEDGVTSIYRIENNRHLGHIMRQLSLYDVQHKVAHVWGIKLLEVDEKDVNAELLNKLIKHLIAD